MRDVKIQPQSAAGIIPLGLGYREANLNSRRRMICAAGRDILGTHYVFTTMIKLMQPRLLISY